MIHILPAGKGEVAGVLNAAKTGKPVSWIVSMGAHAGDQALFHLPNLGLAARGVIGTEPRDQGQGRYGRYTATVRKIALLDPPVSLAFLRKNHPSWKWPNFPKGKTTIKGPIEERLKELLAGYPNGDDSAKKKERQERERVEAVINVRRGQPKFRQDLLHAYGHRCAISGCDADAALEAAHIRTFPGKDANHVGNGLILRADLHSLFDLGLICVQTSTWTVVVKPELRSTSYKSFHRRPVKLARSLRPRLMDALNYHRFNVFKMPAGAL